jgi:arsenate reductase
MKHDTGNVLFIRTGNSARSIPAEGLMNELVAGRFVSCPAGSRPKRSVHPLAIRTLAAHRMSTDGLRSRG